MPPRTAGQMGKYGSISAAEPRGRERSRLPSAAQTAGPPLLCYSAWLLSDCTSALGVLTVNLFNLFAFYTRSAGAFSFLSPIRGLKSSKVDKSQRLVSLFNRNLWK